MKTLVFAFNTLLPLAAVVGVIVQPATRASWPHEALIVVGAAAIGAVVSTITVAVCKP